MWSSENQRLGMKEVSKKAYFLESIGDTLNVFSPLVFIILLVYLPIRSIEHGWFSMIYLGIPVITYLAGAIMRGTSETILNKIGYRYDYENDMVSVGNKVIRPK